MTTGAIEGRSGAMELAELTVPLARLSRLEEPWDRPLAIVELDRADTDVRDADLRLPPCPVIGVGERDHPWAARCDAIIEPRFGLPTIARGVLARPCSAAALVQILRATQDMGIADALTFESMAYAMLQGSSEHLHWRSEHNAQAPQAVGAVTVLREEGQLAVTLDRPWAGNAIDRAMRDGLASALSLAALDPSITRVMLRGSGKAFSLGADLAEFGTTTDPATAHAIRHLTLPARAAIACADRLEVHVDGACVGAGLEFAAFASRVTATSRSWFQLPELGMGIIPGAGGCVSLPRRIGRQRTALMVLSGRRIGAQQALDWGLVDALIDDAPGDEGSCDVI